MHSVNNKDIRDCVRSFLPLPTDFYYYYYYFANLKQIQKNNVFIAGFKHAFTCWTNNKRVTVKFLRLLFRALSNIFDGTLLQKYSTTIGR